MSVYPYNLTPEGAPTDATGSYPAVAGYTPMTTGRRVAIALADGVIGGAVGGLAAFVILGDMSWGLPVGVGLSVVYGILTLWAVFGRSARLAGLLMKAQYVDVRTGRLKGGSLFVKQLLQGVLAGLTFGIVPLVLVFASVKSPMRRNFFDRATQLMLVDGRSGRRPGAPIENAGPPQAPPNIAAVQFDPAQSPTAWGGPGSVYESPVRTVTGDGGVITAVPGRGGPPAAPHPVPAPVVPVLAPAPMPPPAPQPVPGSEHQFFARPGHPGEAVEADRTVLAPNALDGAVTSPTTPEVTLDGNHTLLIGPPLVFGRNPVAPGSHPDAVAHRIDDALLSKTHLLLGRDETGVWIIDLNSTNGCRVAMAPDALPRSVEPGRKVWLHEGSSVHFGQHRITVG